MVLEILEVNDTVVKARKAKPKNSNPQMSQESQRPCWTYENQRQPTMNFQKAEIYTMAVSIRQTSK